MSVFISVHALRKQGKINEASVLTKLRLSLGLDAALIGKMTEEGKMIVTVDMAR